MKILILDDDQARAEDWKQEISKSLGGGANIVVYDNKNVGRVISELHEKRLSAREGSYQTVVELDEVDLLIVDYDLLRLDTDGRSAWSTGAEVAYAARLMSKVGPIVVVNQYGTNSFDLTMRRTSPSYADLDLGSKHITSTELWKDGDFEDFRPWHWPNLLREPSRFNDLSAFVLENLDNSVVEVLGLELSDFDSPRYVSPELLARLGLSRKGGMTFRQLLVGTQKEDGKHQPNPISVFNILEKDAELVKDMPSGVLSRLGAAVLSHWVERLILPNQELIADAPHLAYQYPWILENHESTDAWKGLARLDEVVGLTPVIENYRVHPTCLVSRAAYWAGQVKREIDVPEEFSMANVPDLAFCEDTSSFKDKSECKSFPSDLQTFDRERWVSDDLSAGGEKVNYEPQAYLLM
ncbi:hypothetical protein F3I62_16690 [Pseudomonas sp. R-28-1W-6]|uniref:hypothetical protein n=1 Tax=Pseudomonas sp. R-28-1W-6 TaxID=2650101 RepID=UPI0013652C12|nr:hypothetical protein [Pseudomonas sp. R-28-1W-6]MWV13739.1 hypothetical protein [Pseudomonas sp. R-28-1W-6]